jgi:hypothetical protein
MVAVRAFNPKTIGSTPMGRTKETKNMSKSLLESVKQVQEANARA